MPTLRLVFFAFLIVLAGRAPALDLSILDSGAESGGQKVNTTAIQSAIDQVSAAGGGRVIVPSGVFLTGAFDLKQGAELHLAKGAVLLGSTDLADYPRRMTRIEGRVQMWRPALVNASGLTRVRVTGEGVLDGNGRPFWGAFWKRRQEDPKCTNLEVERPRLLFIEDSTDILIRGVMLKDSGFWNLHLYRCRNALLKGLTITAPHGDPPKITDASQPWDEVSVDRAPSSDGIDIDSCQNVTVRDCTISVGDDCIALKGTKGPLALQDAASPPVSNILVQGCDFQSGHGMLTCGSEATLIRNVTVQDCRVGGGVPVVRFKLRPDTPQRYENFVFEDLRLEGAQALFDVKPWTQFFDLQGHAPRPSSVSNVVLRNVRGTVGSLGELRGNAGDQIQNVVLEGVEVTAADARLSVGDGVGVRAAACLVNGRPYSPE